MKQIFASLLLCVLAVPGVAQDTGVKDWEQIYKVLSHPRCANCHTPDDRPRWFEAKNNMPRIHAMNVRRGSDGMGNAVMRCNTCHQAQNSSATGGPPGAPNWHLAPIQMAWFGKTSAEICAQFKDPARTGNRDLSRMAGHVKSDKLVAWGWSPGEGREAAPGSALELYDAITRWQSSGAPCP